MTRTKVLVLSTDPVTDRMPGPAIRAWHLAGELSRSCEVVLGSTVACSVEHPDVATRYVDVTQDLPALEAWMDVLVAPAGVLGFWPSLAATGKAVVFDLYDPYHLEHLEPVAAGMTLEERAGDIEIFNAAIMAHLACGDFFLCASERQRDLWIGSLMAARRVNPWTYEDQPALQRLIVTVPFGLSSEPPTRHGASIADRIPGITPDDDVILWGGGIYNWLDPVSTIMAVDELRTSRPDIRLVFLGFGHPNPATPAMQVATDARAVSDRLQLTDRFVFFYSEWVPYDERSDFLLDAKVGITTHKDHLETRYSFRTRVLDYLWAQLPMVLTEGDVLSALVDHDGLGVAVAPGDPGAIAEALDHLLDASIAPEVFTAVTSTMTWEHVAAPLVAFCEEPRKAPDRAFREVRPVSGTPPLDQPREPGAPDPSRRRVPARIAPAVAVVAVAVGAAAARRRQRR